MTFDLKTVWQIPEDQKILREKATSPFVVIHGQPLCLTRGFDKLEKPRSAIHMKLVRTPVEEMTRPMRKIFVIKYYPVINRYEDMGEYWADVKTGSLYDEFDGRCLSSDMLKMVI